MSRGIIEAQTLRSEQFEFEGRTSDPADAEPGEYWIRVDQTGTNPDVIAQLRRQDTSGVTACPIFAASEESNLGADVVRGPSVVLDSGSVGFVAMTTGGGAVGSPRAVNSAGAQYVSHNALELNSIPPDTGDYQWYVSEGSGTTLNPDVGAVSATIANASWVSDADAVDGQHLSHDGSGDYWQTDSAVLSTPFSVGGWVRFDDMTAFDKTAIGVGDSNAPNRVGADGDGALLTAFDGSSYITGHQFPSAGNWGFLALNFESDQHRLITWSNSQELADTTNNNGQTESGELLTVGASTDGDLTGDTDFFVVQEGSLITKSEWADLWQATQR